MKPDYDENEDVMQSESENCSMCGEPMAIGKHLYCLAVMQSENEDMVGVVIAQAYHNTRVLTELGILDADGEVVEK